MLVVLLGPDGVGKTSIATALTSELSRDFKRVEHYHFRPGAIPRLRDLLCYKGYDPPPEQPHGAPVPGLLSSLARFAYYSLDFVIGARVSRFRAFRHPDILVLVERYYMDILVDPARYCMAVPPAVVRLIRPLVPRPDLAILLDADVSTITARKRELPEEELARQICLHRRTIYEWGNRIAVIDATRPFEEVLRECAAAVRAARTVAR